MSSGRFVGRERERAELEAALEEVVSGRGRLFLFGGEPGIGKTRLAEVVANDAASRCGARVSWGSAWESDGAPSHWPWIQVLRSLIEGADAARLRAQIGHGLPYLVQLLPELKQVLPEAEEAPSGPASLEPSLDPARQRFYLFDAVTRFVVTASAERPHVIVLDDLQWADVPTILLLRFLARELKAARLLVLGTYRDVEARSRVQVGELLGSLAREGQVIHVGGLSEAEVGRLATSWDRERASDELIARLYRTTEGNPFFVEGILRLLASEPRGGGERARAHLPIPEEVRDAVRQRLTPLPKGLRELLVVAATLGREFDHGALVAASGMASGEVFALVAEARGLGIIAETKMPHRGRFAHDLFREVLHGDLPPAERMRVHESVGSALESYYGNHATEAAAELAGHFFSALPLADVRRAIEYGKLAARRAIASYAWEEAVAELDRVLAALESQPGASDHERLELLLDLGESVWRSEDLTRHREVFTEALSIARALRLPAQLARAVLGLVGAGPAPGGVDDDKVGLLEEALSMVEEDDLLLRGRLLVQLAWQTYFSSDRDRRRTADECVRIARRAGDPALLVQALRRRHTSLLGSPHDLAERIAIGDEMLDLARRTGNREVLLLAELIRVINCFETGDVAVLDAELASYARGAGDVREPFHVWFSTALQATRALTAGRWEVAERLSMEAMSAGMDVQPKNATETFGVHQYQLHYERGRIADLVPTIRAYIDGSPTVPSWRAAMALACSDLGLAREARTEFEVLFADDLESLPTDYMRPAMLVQLAMVASFLGDTRRAEPLLTRLAPFSGQSILVAYGAACSGAADRFLGLLCSTLSRWDEGERYFESALAMNRRMGMLPAIARTQVDYAAMKLRRGAEGDAADAESMLREAAATARDLEMMRLVEQAEERMETLASAAPSAAAAEAASLAVLRREGDFWTVGWRGTSFRLRHLKGLGYIDKLIRAQGCELHCVDVLGDEMVDLGDGGETLDAGAKAAYRRRLEDLREEMAEAEANHDVGRGSRARAEMEVLAEELSSAVGLGGHDRRAARNLERARIRLTRSIRDAIARIGKHDADLGRHLSTAIRTGAFCSYTPDPTSPITWRL